MIAKNKLILITLMDILEVALVIGAPLLKAYHYFLMMFAVGGAHVQDRLHMQVALYLRSRRAVLCFVCFEHVMQVLLGLACKFSTKEYMPGGSAFLTAVGKE